MKFKDPSLDALLNAPSMTIQEQAERQNLCLEEKAANRQAAYESFVGSKADWPAWRGRHLDYVNENVRRRDPLSETFAPGGPALYAGIEENQWLLRVERLDRVLGKFFAVTPAHDTNWQGQLDQLNGWIKSRDQTKAATPAKPKVLHGLKNLRAAVAGLPDTPEAESLADLTETLNLERKDGRPSFVAFAPEFPGIDTDPDWASSLVEHCGLAHLQNGRPIPLALMRYQVRDVLAAWRGGRATVFALPSVLDQEFYGVFHPAPLGLSQGHALDLDPADECRSLAAEMLHARIDYRSEHWVKAGLYQAAPFVDARLPGLRLRHLDCLRTLSGTPDYGVACP